MKITYLGHSGFLVEAGEHYLLFDYFYGGLPAFLPEKKLTVFVSHSHRDHYNKDIFTLQREDAVGRDRAGEKSSEFCADHAEITYVLSGDIRRKQAEELVAENSGLVFAKAHETYTLYGDRVTIETLRSTDVGVAYLVTVAEDAGRPRCFYHAGDLNLWKWPGGTKAVHNNMEANYRREMALLEGRHFDAAFVPIDPRLEQFAFGGMDLFLEAAKADVVFPMHFWKQPEIVREYQEMRPRIRNLILPQEGRTYKF